MNVLAFVTKRRVDRLCIYRAYRLLSVHFVAVATSEVMRCEPSWKWQISAEHAAVVKQLRPRSRLGPPRLRAAERDLVYQWCNDLGRLANIEERHWLAHAFFESAYNTKEDVAMLISSVNMRLNAGQSFLK